jgi:hypothetical protein
MPTDSLDPHYPEDSQDSLRADAQDGEGDVQQLRPVARRAPARRTKKAAK